jgi:phosphate transport system ATP-binding protein
VTAIRNAPLLTLDRVDFWYGAKQALFAVDLDIHDREVLAFIGPSGCGKSTLLRCLNRMNDVIAGARVAGRIEFDGEDVYAPDVDPPVIRKRFGWVAQKPNPFPWSIRENVAYGARLHGLAEGAALEDHVRRCLERAGLWAEVADTLGMSGLDLSGGQQQRLCIARALSTEPEVLLMDEPCGSLDPIATERVERLIGDLRRDRAIVIVTHNLMQARRIADRVAFFYEGRIVEIGPTAQIFDAPRTERCARYVNGEYG